MSVSESSEETLDGLPPESFDLSALLGTIKRRAVLIVGIITLFITLSLVWVLRQAPLYSSQSLIQVSQHRTALDREREPLLNKAQIDALVAGELRFLSSDNFLLAVIRSEKINKWQEYAKLLTKIPEPRILDYPTNGDKIPPTPAEGVLLRALRGRLSAAREGETYIVSLTALSEKPELAARLVNAAARIYASETILRGQRELQNLKDRIALQLLRDRETLLKDDRKIEDALNKGVRNIDKSARPLFEQRLVRIKQTRAKMEKALQAVIAKIQPEDTRVTSIEDTSATTDTLGPSANGGHNQATPSGSQLVDIRDFGIKRNEMLDMAWKLLQDMRPYLEMRHKGALFENISDTLKAARVSIEVYLGLIKRLIDLDLRARLYVSGINILTYGLVPPSPSFPKKRNTVILSAIFGSAAGLIVAIILDFFSKNIISSRQIAGEGHLDEVFFLKLKPRQISQVFGQTNGTVWHLKKLEFEHFVRATKKRIQTQSIGVENCIVSAFVSTEANRDLGLITRSVAGSVKSDGGGRVAVLDLDRDHLISEGWLKKKIRAVFRKWKRVPEPEIQHHRNLFFDIDEYYFKNIDPSLGIPVSPRALAAIIETMKAAYDHLLVVCPFPYGNEINAAIAENADSVTIVSMYARSRVTHISNLAEWFAEHARRDQRIISAVFGAS